MSKLQEKPSALKREHPALQNIEFLHFFLLIALQNPGPDPHHWITVRYLKITFFVFICSEEQYREEFLRGCSPHGRILDEVYEKTSPYFVLQHFFTHITRYRYKFWVCGYSIMEGGR
jgi:hypothetical protein